MTRRQAMLTTSVAPKPKPEAAQQAVRPLPEDLERLAARAGGLIGALTAEGYAEHSHRATRIPAFAGALALIAAAARGRWRIDRPTPLSLAITPTVLAFTGAGGRAASRLVYATCSDLLDAPTPAPWFGIEESGSGGATLMEMRADDTSASALIVASPHVYANAIRGGLQDVVWTRRLHLAVPGIPGPLFGRGDLPSGVEVANAGLSRIGAFAFDTKTHRIAPADEATMDRLESAQTDLRRPVERGEPHGILHAYAFEQVVRLAGILALSDAATDPAADLRSVRMTAGHVDMARDLVLAGIDSFAAVLCPARAAA